MIRTCIIDLSASAVVNVIEYEKITTGTPPGMDEGFLAVPSASAQIGWAWDGVNFNPPHSSESIADAKSRLWGLIKTERDRLTQNGGYPLDGYWFHSDAYSLSQQQGLILAAMQTQAAGGDMDAPLMATPWQAMGGVPVVMTANLALRLLPAAMAQQVAIFEAAKAHKVALDACADPANYNFSGGWPKVFGEQP